MAAPSPNSPYRIRPSLDDYTTDELVAQVQYWLVRYAEPDRSVDHRWSCLLSAKVLIAEAEVRTFVQAQEHTTREALAPGFYRAEREHG